MGGTNNCTGLWFQVKASDANRSQHLSVTALLLFTTLMQRRLVRFIPLENPQAEGTIVELRHDSRSYEVGWRTPHQV
jgi:hypothetical protein